MGFVANLKTTVLMACLIGLCMAVGYALGGENGLIFGLMFGGLGNVFGYFFSDKIALMANGGRLIERQELPWLFDIIENLCNRAGLPMPKVAICPQEAPNAFATGRNPHHAVVAITRGMINNFPPREIEGVLAHELGHVKHRDMLTSTIAAVLAAMISSAAQMFFWFGGGGNRRSGENNPLGAVGLILMLVLGPIAAMIIQLAISRQREYSADWYGGELCGDPNKLADALERLEARNQQIPMDTNPAFHSLYIMQPLSAGGISTLFSTHPPTEKRIAALRKEALHMR